MVKTPFPSKVMDKRSFDFFQKRVCLLKDYAVHYKIALKKDGGLL